MATSQINVYGSSGNIGTASLPTMVATTNLIPGQALMLTTTGQLVPNDGTKPVAAWAPVGGAVAGQSFTPQAVTDVNEHPTNVLTPFTPGVNYYIQPNGSTDVGITQFYAGTAISGTALIYDPSRALASGGAVATTNTLNALTHGAPASAPNRLLMTDEECRAYKAVDLVLLNGFTATSAKIFYNVNVAVIAFADLLDTTPESAQKKICDLPISVATSPLCCINGESGLTGYVAGFASATEVFANKYVDSSTTISTVCGTFMRLTVGVDILVP
jgi:hypothetical protein